MERKAIAKIISWNTHNEAVCASAAKMSTTKGNANEIFEKTVNNPGNTELIKKVLHSGHKSVIEHAVFSIAFWDVSAYVEQFLIECRLASFTVKSRRYVDFSNLGYLIPADLKDEDLKQYCEYVDFLFDGYRVLLDKGIPKEDARFVLPYSFCSNFYCTLNARELGNLINAIQHGRGRGIPELQEIATQLIDQIATIFPALLSEFECGCDRNQCANPTAPFALSQNVEFVNACDAGNLELLQAPQNPEKILMHAALTASPNQSGEIDIAKLVNSSRPRELEHLTYTFAITDLTLSGITHLVRHRMQSIVLPSIQLVNHSRYIIPDTIEHDLDAKAYYIQLLTAAHAKLRKMMGSEILKGYSYYLAVSGNMMNVMTTMNARELMLFIRLRSCNRAQWEIRHVATRMLALLREHYPKLFNLFGPTCVIKGMCPEGRLSCGKKEEMMRLFGTK